MKKIPEIKLLTVWQLEKLMDMKPRLKQEKRVSRYAWETGDFNGGAAFLYSLVNFIQPKIIIELGTFEAHGTLILHRATRLNGAQIYTIDCDITLNNPHQDQLLVDKIRRQRILGANREGSTRIKFLKGDTRQVLKRILPKINSIDFVFQDSMHFVPGLLEEFDLLRPKLSRGAVVIFDDWWMVKLKHWWLLPYFKKRFSPNISGNPQIGPFDMTFNCFEINRGKGFLVLQRLT
ncbi:MAG: class I SAM-dependent methyltransferase [Patescibacteria group bacterium]